jgi:hypothetical protein
MDDRITDKPPGSWDGITSKPQPTAPREQPSWLRQDAEPRPSALHFFLRTVTIWVMVLLGGFLAMCVWWTRMQLGK